MDAPVPDGRGDLQRGSSWMASECDLGVSPAVCSWRDEGISVALSWKFHFVCRVNPFGAEVDAI